MLRVQCCILCAGLSALANGHVQVQAFYEQMGSVLASRCDELGASQTKQTSSRSSARQGSRAVGSATQSSNVEEVT